MFISYSTFFAGVLHEHRDILKKQTLCKEGMKQCAPLRWVGLWPFPKRMAVSKIKKAEPNDPANMVVSRNAVIPSDATLFMF